MLTEKNKDNYIPLEDKMNKESIIKKDERWKGILYAILTGICMTLVQAFGKYLFLKYPQILFPE